MLKSLKLAALALSLTIAPGLAHAKDAPVAEPARVYANVDFDTASDPENILLLDLSTGERVAIRLMPDWAPNHIDRIKTLTRRGFYDGVIFHRVIDGFMAQTGDPTGTGTGGSDLPDIKAEFNDMPHVRGTVSMARAQSEDSANSQFFVVFYPASRLIAIIPILAVLSIIWRLWMQSSAANHPQTPHALCRHPLLRTARRRLHMLLPCRMPPRSLPTCSAIPFPDSGTFPTRYFAILAWHSLRPRDAC
jgi:cyclophilin family peptidyl-prolyl cis-trans isomerase